MIRLAVRYVLVALLLAGSATLLFSCGNSDEADLAASDEKMMTEYSENLTVIMSRNGRRSYIFTTPLVEGYSLAREPYREFRKGVKITTYQDDSLSAVDAVLTANYAIYYEKRELWEAKGNVVVEKSDGKTLYTQQLFWNARTKKIYSNVDSKIVQAGGRDVFIGEGFESDEEFSDWRFRRMKGRMEVDVAPTDSTAAERPAVQDAPASSARRGSPAATPKPTAVEPPKTASDASSGLKVRRIIPASGTEPAPVLRKSRKSAAEPTSKSSTGAQSRKPVLRDGAQAVPASAKKGILPRDADVTPNM